MSLNGPPRVVQQATDTPQPRLGAIAGFASRPDNFRDVFGSLRIRPATLAMNFRVPFFRELLVLMGVISVSRKSLTHVLERGAGNAVLVVPAPRTTDPGTHDLLLGPPSAAAAACAFARHRCLCAPSPLDR
eukprot:gene16281-56869_t